MSAAPWKLQWSWTNQQATSSILPHNYPQFHWLIIIFPANNVPIGGAMFRLAHPSAVLSLANSGTSLSLSASSQTQVLQRKIWGKSRKLRQVGPSEDAKMGRKNGLMFPKKTLGFWWIVFSWNSHSTRMSRQNDVHKPTARIFIHTLGA